MQSERLETIFKRDLDRLDGLADDEWLPRTRGPRRHVTGAGVAAFAAITVALLVVALSALAVRDAHVAEERSLTTSQPYVVESQGASSSATANAWLTSSPTCPRGQLVALDITQPPPPGSLPGTGAAGAEAAFRRANPAISDFRMYPWGESQPASGNDPRLRDTVWIVAGDQTYIAMRIGGAPSNVSWFAYPAKVVGCRTPTNFRIGPPTGRP